MSVMKKKGFNPRRASGRIATEKEHMYLTTSEVAEELRISAVTVQKLLATGEMRGIRIGKVWRIRKADLHEYLERHTNTNQEAEA